MNKNKLCIVERLNFVMTVSISLLVLLMVAAVIDNVLFEEMYRPVLSVLGKTLLLLNGIGAALILVVLILRKYFDN